MKNKNRNNVMVKLIEWLFKVKIYPCFHNHAILNEKEFLSLCDEMRALTTSALGTAPDYQCLKKDYAQLKDKLLIVIRDKHGKLQAFASAVVIPSAQVGAILHYGLFVVAPENRHCNFQFKLGVATGLTFLCHQPLRRKYWFTSLTSVLSIMATFAKTHQQVFPSPQYSQPSPVQQLLAEEFRQGVAERCHVSSTSFFDKNTFIFQRANAENCFKKNVDESFKSLSRELNQFYSSRMQLENGDAQLQIGSISFLNIFSAIAHYLYRIFIRSKFIRKTQFKERENVFQTKIRNKRRRSHNTA